MLLIDKIIISLLITFFLSGWFRGALKSLIGPFSFLACALLAVFFYDLNNNILFAGIIVVAGTIIVSTFLSIAFAVGMLTVHKEFRGKVMLPSRILGSLINLAWQGNLTFVVLILLLVFPASGSRLEKFQDQIAQSTGLHYYDTYVIRPYPPLEATVSTLTILRNPAEIEQVMKMNEYIELSKELNTQEFANNPHVAEALEKKNYIMLLNEPAFWKFAQNDSAMAKLTRLIQKIYRARLHAIQQRTSAAAAAPNP